MSEVRTDQSEFYERQLPTVPTAAWVLALLALLIGVGAWEYAMRGLGLETWDLGDGPGDWVAERRKIDAGDVDVAIIGASRILFDTDLDVFEEVTGLRPIQLALAGTNARAFLTDLADDQDFNGLVILGMTELVYFTPTEMGGLYAAALTHYSDETPSERFGQQLYLRLQRLFAFIDSEYTLPRLIARLPLQRREGPLDPYDAVWKIGTNEADRQTRLWHRIESPGRLRAHARHAWVADWEHLKSDYLKGLVPDALTETIATTSRDIEKLRARGGEVVFVRCPSSDFYRDIERQYFPRTKIYDRLIAETNTLGLHFEDYEATRGLNPPEWSHLSAADAKAYTRAFAEELVRQSAWLQARMARPGLILSPFAS